ncbi:23097_t:CDS:2 [Gigaspora margarita]|uniref:23097_t:CDS:1 n=1 Tax=Gigaspora margarita TaxID=4874 RepID=A0ABM8VVJ8_GIGMA|nr:23097_t:CDS:2 [Gigaspora margarita]
MFWLDENYPLKGNCTDQSFQNKANYGKERKEIKSLNITSLDLSDCVNLEEINIQYNNLEELDVSNLDKLRKLDLFSGTLKRLILGNRKQHLSYLSCDHNQLTCLDFNALEPRSLIYLSLTDNNFSEQDLAVFLKFTNLNWLLVGYYEYNGKSNNNQFYGSSKFWKGLRNLNKLRFLYLNNLRLSKEKHDLEKGSLPTGYLAGKKWSLSLLR